MRFARFRSTFAIAAISTALLVGCSASTPDDKEGKAHILKNESVDGEYKAVNITRNNGWPEADGQYKVEFKYDLVAEADYEDVVQSYIDAYEKNPDGNFAPGLEAMNAMNVTAAAVTDRESNGRGFVGITRQNLRQNEDGQLFLAVGERMKKGDYSEKFKEYIRGAEGEQQDLRVRNVLYAIVGVEKVGIKPETKKGQVFMHKTWPLLYKKTEKGWQLT